MSSSNPSRRRVLVIAGSDSSGGAGLEADQRVLALHNCYALTTTTALTAQNTTGVKNIHPIPSSFVEESIETIWDDLATISPAGSGSETAADQNDSGDNGRNTISVIKTGMLSHASTVKTISRILRQKRDQGYSFKIVLDPVMKSTSGAQLLEDEAVDVLRSELLPLASIVTPNLAEALLLVSSATSGSDTTGGDRKSPETIDDLIALARDVAQLCSPETAVLVKGGHFLDGSLDRASVDTQTRQITDVLIHNGCQVRLFKKEYIHSANTHGTGCSLASAIAAHLAHGRDIETAVERACAYVQDGIQRAATWELGHGSGPIDHWAEEGRLT